MDKEFLRIKEAIKAAGYTYETFGAEVGLSKTSIARIATGEQTPSFDNLKTIADALKVNIGDLFAPTFKKEESPQDKINTIKQLLSDLEKDLK